MMDMSFETLTVRNTRGHSARILTRFPLRYSKSWVARLKRITLGKMGRTNGLRGEAGVSCSKEEFGHSKILLLQVGVDFATAGFLECLPVEQWRQRRRGVDRALPAAADTTEAGGFEDGFCVSVEQAMV